MLEDSYKNKKDRTDKALSKMMLKWLSSQVYNNTVKIDYDFEKHIKKALNRRCPVLLNFNWTMFFKFSKENSKGEYDPINGVGVDHAVVANGYDKNGIWIVDSHHEYYKYSRKKYRRGFYKMKWGHLLTCMGSGDVIVPEEYEGSY